MSTYPLLLLLPLLLPLLLHLFLLPLSASEKVIIKGNQTILSSKSIFRLGFFTPTNGQSFPSSSSSSSSSSSNWYLGIWYASIPTPTYVWVANRNRPLSDLYSSTLQLTSTGTLIATNSRDGVVWQTDNKYPATDFRFSDTGNLILTRDDGFPVWQSFENPTDTWLPGMNVTGQTALTSWRTLFDPSPGFYSLRLNQSFNEFQLVYNGNKPYWSTGNWTGEAFVGVPEMTIPYIYRFHFVNPYTPKASFWYIVTPSDTAREPGLTRFLVGANGQLKQYTWEPQTQSWNMFWLQPEDPCRVYSLCGRLGFCSSELLKPCACIRGFRPKDDGAWRSEDYSDGCRRESGESCDMRDTFEAVGDLRYDGDVEMSQFQVSRSSCAKICLGNCSCVGFYHKEKSNLCKILLESPINVKNSSSSTGISDDILYIRDPRKGNSKGNISKSIIILCSVVGSISVLGFTLFVPLILLKRKKTRKEDEDGFAVLNLKVFSFKELQTATNGFSEKLGHGGFGAVFKGTLPDSFTFVAVKRLERPGSGEGEFRAEVCTIGNIQHVNLVRLRGFCSENQHRLLVYDYMPNGSLSSYLSRTSPKLLSWDARFRIALGTAKGIAYLHEGCRDCIIHCDIKPENILLDSDYNAKVSDFGLAKLVGRDFSRVLATMRGTWGYVAPEWISGLPITTKADVYSFGMTLLELIGGRRNVIVNSDTLGGKEEKAKEMEPEKWFFPPWAAREIIQGNVDSVVDSRLNQEYNTEEATRMATVAIWCIQDNEEMRPAMGTVVKMLEGVVEVTVPPPPKLIQALVSGESYQGVGNGLSGTSCSDPRGCSDLITGLSSPGSRSSFVYILKMADKEEAAGENTTRGSDWEVVSLTASAYAAAPGPKEVDLKDDDKEDTRYEAETSHPLYMSRHFAFPQSELENTATAPSELTEIYEDKSSKKMDFGFSVEQETRSHEKEDADLTLKGFNLSDEFAEVELFKEKGKREENIYSTAMSSLHNERAIGGSHVYEQNEPIHEPTEPVTPWAVSPDLNPTKDEKHEVGNVNAPPCAAWWKRSAASLISQAKETNTVWSIFIAAAVMGIVILGKRWQQERWQILQLKWESSIGNEKAGRLMGPISRLKQAFVVGQRRDSFIRVSSQNES